MLPRSQQRIGLYNGSASGIQEAGMRLHCSKKVLIGHMKGGIGARPGEGDVERDDIRLRQERMQVDKGIGGTGWYCPLAGWVVHQNAHAQGFGLLYDAATHIPDANDTKCLALQRQIEPDGEFQQGRGYVFCNAPGVAAGGIAPVNVALFQHGDIEVVRTDGCGANKTNGGSLE